MVAGQAAFSVRVLVTSDWQLTVAQTNCSASIFNFGTAEMAASQKFGHPALDTPSTTAHLSLCTFVTLPAGQRYISAENLPEGVMFSPHLSFYTVFFFVVLAFPYHLDHIYIYTFNCTYVYIYIHIPQIGRAIGVLTSNRRGAVVTLAEGVVPWWGAIARSHGWMLLNC